MTYSDEGQVLGWGLKRQALSNALLSPLREVDSSWYPAGVSQRCLPESFCTSLNIELQPAQGCCTRSHPFPQHTHTHLFNSHLIKGGHGAGIGPCGLACPWPFQKVPMQVTPAAVCPAPPLQYIRWGAGRASGLPRALPSSVLAGALRGPAAGVAGSRPPYLAFTTSTW